MEQECGDSGRGGHHRKEYTVWSRPGTSDEDGPIKNETWRPIKKWFIGGIRVPPGMDISSEGRLRTRHGVTKGHCVELEGEIRAFAGTDVGLLDLSTCSGEREDTISLAPRLVLARQALLSGNSAENLAIVADISLNTAFAYFCQAAQTVPPSQLEKLAATLVSSEMRTLLLKMRRTRNTTLGGPLQDLFDVASPLLS